MMSEMNSDSVFDNALDDLLSLDAPIISSIATNSFFDGMTIDEICNPKAEFTDNQNIFESDNKFSTSSQNPSINIFSGITNNSKRSNTVANSSLFPLDLTTSKRFLSSRNIKSEIFDEVEQLFNIHPSISTIQSSVKHEIFANSSDKENFHTFSDENSVSRINLRTTSATTPLTPTQMFKNPSQSEARNPSESEARNPSESEARNPSQSEGRNPSQSEVRNANSSSREATLPKDLSLIPMSIGELHNLICESYSDFAFVYALSAQMCQDLMPMEFYVNLKMGLLLSIASIQKDSDNLPFPVVAIGSDITSANLIMNHIGNVAKRFLSSTDDFQSVQLAKNNFVEAGPMLLAKGGVYFVGDWSRLKTANGRKVLKEIETGRVFVNKIMETCPVECAVWCYWNNWKSNKKEMDLIATFTEIFGLPLMLGEATSDSLMDFKLEKAGGASLPTPADVLAIDVADVREFLKTISNRRVDFTNEAENILRNYFIAARLDRPGCLSKQSYVAMRLMAESLAKISLRHEVIEIDAIGAIYFAENFMTTIYGPGVYPSPVLKDTNCIERVHQYINEFTGWVQEYIIRLSTD